MITAEALLNIAFENEKIYNERVAIVPVGYDRERNDAHKLMEQALFCAAEMFKEFGKAETLSFGPFGLQTIAKGTKVRLKKGAKIRSTSPKYRGKYSENARARMIEVHRVAEGFASTRDFSGYEQVRHPEVVWVGSGGYWFWVSINDIELV
jgi:hypothetical protein